MGRRSEIKTTKIGTVYTASSPWLQNFSEGIAHARGHFRVSSVSLDGLKKRETTRSLGTVGLS